METKEIKVSGLVQGVGFRCTTQIIANKLNIFGNVKNNSDATVTIIAQGPTNNLAIFIKKIKACPTPAGRIDKVIITNLSDYPKLHSFQVIS